MYRNKKKQEKQTAASLNLWITFLSYRPFGLSVGLFGLRPNSPTANPSLLDLDNKEALRAVDQIRERPDPGPTLLHAQRT